MSATAMLAIDFDLTATPVNHNVRLVSLVPAVSTPAIHVLTMLHAMNNVLAVCACLDGLALPVLILVHRVLTVVDVTRSVSVRMVEHVIQQMVNVSVHQESRENFVRMAAQQVTIH